MKMLRNTKAQHSKTAIVLGISAFYIFLGLFMGFFGDTFDGTDKTISERGILSYDNETDQANGFFGRVANLKIFSFFGNIVTGLGALPFWLNTILFAPLGVMVLFLIISSLPTFNGGG